MTVAAFVADRMISQVVHFTTNAGVLGVLASRALKSRTRLPEDSYLEFIYKPNCVVRKDPDWLDYVSLSIEKINSQFFEIASGKWHKGMDGFWCVIAIDPVIMSHDGVYFATTNNMYSGVRRAKSRGGLEALYAERIHQYETKYSVRGAMHSDSHPTCPQAEVLYPGELPSGLIRRIYVQNEEQAATIDAQCVAVGHPVVEVVVRPEALR